MIRLKLNLPECTVDYNEYGALTSIPVPHTPNQIKNFGIAVFITGYVSDQDFFAISLKSPARDFTIPEQVSLLKSLGFLTIPYVMSEATAGDSLISIRDKFSQFSASWIYPTSGNVFEIPKLTTIKNTLWIMEDKTLKLQVITEDGVFKIFDLRAIEYYQPGNKVKVFNGELLPFHSAPIINPIPTLCPKCNNPLKRVQIYSDLPLMYKCTSAFCDMLVLDEPGDGLEASAPEINTPVSESQEVSSPAESESFPAESPEISDSSEVVEVSEVPKLCVINLECTGIPEELLNQVNFTDDESAKADYIVTKGGRSITKRSRNLSKETGIPMISLDELEEKVR